MSRANRKARWAIRPFCWVPLLSQKPCAGSNVGWDKLAEPAPAHHLDAIKEMVGQRPLRGLVPPYFRVKTTQLVVAAVLLAAAGPALLRAQEPSHNEPKTLTFCAEPAAMPRTGKAADSSPQGLDIAV